MKLNWLPWLFLSVLLFSACSAGDWESYRLGGEAAYKMAVPAGAERQLPGAGTLVAAGREIPLEITEFRRDEAAYSVARGTLPEEAEAAEEIKALLDDVQAWVAGSGTSGPDGAALSWNGYPGRDVRYRLSGDGSEMRAATRIILLEEALYLVTIRGPEAVVDGQRARFLASFSAGDD